MDGLRVTNYDYDKGNTNVPLPEMDRLWIENDQVGIINYGTKLSTYGSTKLFDVKGGEIVKIVSEINNRCFFKIYSCPNKKLELSTDIYYNDQNVIKRITRNLCLVLIGIPNQNKRLMISKHNEYKSFLLGLKLRDIVQVNGAILNVDQHLLGVIKYIGPVPQIGPGTYIGVEFNDEDTTISITKHIKKIAKKLWKCKNNNGCIINYGGFFTRTRIIDQSEAQSLRLKMSESIMMKYHFPNTNEYEMTSNNFEAANKFFYSSLQYTAEQKMELKKKRLEIEEFVNKIYMRQEEEEKLQRAREYEMITSQKCTTEQVMEFVYKIYMRQEEEESQRARPQQTNNESTSTSCYRILIFGICFIAVDYFRVLINESQNEGLDQDQCKQWHCSLAVLGIIFALINRDFLLCAFISVLILAIKLNLVC